MIWVTAKSTDVNRRRTVRPIRSKTSGAGGRADSTHVVTGLAVARSSRGFGGGRRADARSSGGADGGRFGTGRRLGGRRALRRPGRARGCRDRGLERPREVGN